ncbi:hypothetical protein PPL_02785 [Heterostelium album PN500]|uniref:Uncharacterized protein n=1 Tax=Heterostelium pallidum (strain ATCC 26659 / Pp 5 / PN500) TaxID=670386 RepID=D3B320_HETP5|nr:hypothetical protein PPL_02785 [Heterostelium album PN500]EFA83718.1 hypothetical protein PPL_02785 [Heterostelium album PN500]|eukprot:XP_020435835.1 hypothetical protein PPL_02785 [Heterostelium album PN500]
MSKWYNAMYDNYRHIIGLQDSLNGKKFILHVDDNKPGFVYLVPWDSDNVQNPGIWVDKLGDNTFVLYSGDPKTKIYHPQYSDCVIDHGKKIFTSLDISGDIITYKGDNIAFTFNDDNTISLTNTNNVMAYNRRSPGLYAGVNLDNTFVKLTVFQVTPYLYDTVETPNKTAEPLSSTSSIKKVVITIWIDKFIAFYSSLCYHHPFLYLD